jgi:two-component system, NarL family, nitrate/nitrite response regulator NarL
MSIAVVLADAHPVVLEGLMCEFAAHVDLTVRACVQQGDAVVRMVRELRPDILVLDFFLPQEDDFRRLAQLQQECPATRAVLFTAHGYDMALEAMRLGVQGVVTKEMAPGMLVRCIRKVHSGSQWLEKGIAARAVSQLLGDEGHNLFGLLTPREIAVARMVSEGLPNKTVASRLAISEGTVKLHLHHVYQKLHLHGRMSLMQFLQKCANERSASAAPGDRQRVGV